MTIIAKTRTGEEYLYSEKESYLVSKASCKQICSIINKVQYKLSDGETWHIYEIADYELPYIGASFQKFRIRKGIVYACQY